jgi:hypothetical protein
MKYSILIVGTLCLGLAACASPNAGNPDGDAYAGGPGGVYDSAANPPRTTGTASYDPTAPLPASAPAPGTTNGSAASGMAPGSNVSR